MTKPRQMVMTWKVKMKQISICEVSLGFQEDYELEEPGPSEIPKQKRMH